MKTTSKCIVSKYVIVVCLPPLPVQSNKLWRSCTLSNSLRPCQWVPTDRLWLTISDIIVFDEGNLFIHRNSNSPNLPIFSFSWKILEHNYIRWGWGILHNTPVNNIIWLPWYCSSFVHLSYDYFMFCLALIGCPVKRAGLLLVVLCNPVGSDRRLKIG